MEDFMNTPHDDEPNKIEPDRDLFGNRISSENSEKANNPPSVNRIGHNRRVYARDLLDRAKGHERRYVVAREKC